MGGSKNSPAEKIIEKLMGLGAEVITYDPYLIENFGAKKAVDGRRVVNPAEAGSLGFKYYGIGIRI